MASSTDPTSFGLTGDVTSHAGHPTSTTGAGLFPSERAGYPNANLRGEGSQRASGAPDPAFSGNATNAGAAETFRSAVGEESGRYGGHEGITDESMFGSSRAKPFKPADERTGAGIMGRSHLIYGLCE